ncbi:CDP-glycerol glycerophosphotransferase family protein [Glutamicibacter nicotianae]
MQNRIAKIKKRAKRYLKDDFNYRAQVARVHPYTVFLESFDGTSQSCHPLAIFEYLLAHKDYQNYKFVWSYRGESPSGYIWNKYSAHKNVTWVRHGSHSYYKRLASSKYLISNSTFPHQFTKNENQIYLNTWHGIPIKRMGYDIPLGVPTTRNVIRNLMAADYILASNNFMAEDIWKKSFKLNGLFRGKILETGSPRIDSQLDNGYSNDELRSLHGIPAGDDREVVLFAPTWRGTSPTNIRDSGKSLAGDYQLLVDGLDSKKYIVLLKVHQLALRGINRSDLSKIRLVDNSIPTNRLLPIVDHMVTDESSIVFDFLIHDRPLHFYFSEEALADSRGLYFSNDSLPGHVSTDIGSVVANIQSARTSNAFAESRLEWKQRFLPHEDGAAAHHIVEAVFQGNQAHIHKAHSCLNEDKKKILIHVGSLIANGITTAAINVANQLAADGHDVSVLYPYSKNENQLAKVYSFDRSVRHFPRVGTIALPLYSRRSYRRYLSEGGREAKNVNLKRIHAIFAHEWTRCFGEARFDTVLAFDGYSVFWAELLLASNAAQKFIWMHNDLMLDSRRTINGSMPHFKNLSSLFTLYNSFDKIVSVSPRLSEINTEKMSKYADKSKFFTVQNFINHEDVIRQSKEYRDFKPDQDNINFVTVGRLSPEKNQARMVRAMKQVVSKFPNVHLYVIGDGPLFTNLDALISSLDLKANIHLLGYHRNPHALVTKCDYFLFSSTYEGQGLAVIEAMVLGKPIVTTKYNVVESVVGKQDGIITENSDDALARGMLEMIESNHPRPKFSATRHNKTALNELRNLIS